jgi:predicted 3-demethylubiquinone-9 3-methyltransferase (glyoxalase superfamily)
VWQRRQRQERHLDALKDGHGGVEFTVAGIPCLGLNGGPPFKPSEAFSFQIATDDQAETDRYWNAIVGNGGQESQCGWCKDRWGLSWRGSRHHFHFSPCSPFGDTAGVAIVT